MSVSWAVLSLSLSFFRGRISTQSVRMAVATCDDGRQPGARLPLWRGTQISLKPSRTVTRDDDDAAAAALAQRSPSSGRDQMLAVSSYANANCAHERRTFCFYTGRSRATRRRPHWTLRGKLAARGQYGATHTGHCVAKSKTAAHATTTTARLSAHPHWTGVRKNNGACDDGGAPAARARRSGRPGTSSARRASSAAAYSTATLSGSNKGRFCRSRDLSRTTGDARTIATWRATLAWGLAHERERLGLGPSSWSRDTVRTSVLVGHCGSGCVCLRTTSGPRRILF